MKQLCILVLFCSLSLPSISQKATSAYSIESQREPLDNPIYFQTQNYCFFLSETSILNHYKKSPIQNAVHGVLRSSGVLDLGQTIELIEAYRSDNDDLINFEGVLFELIGNGEVIFCSPERKCIPSVRIIARSSDPLFSIMDEQLKPIIKRVFRCMGCPSF